MRYVIRLFVAICAASGLWTAAVHAGPQEDCAKWTEPDLSIRACSELIGRNPRDATAYNHRGNAYIVKGDDDRAIADLDKAIRLSPLSAIAYRVRGIAHLGKGDHDRAIADLDKAIRLNPQDTFAYSNRGRAYNAKREYDRAIADYSKAIGLDARYIDFYTARGDAYFSKGDHDRAIADFTQAIKRDPRLAIAYRSRGTAYNRKGDHDRAIMDLNQAVTLNPSDGPAYRERGIAYAFKGDHDRAIDDNSEAVRLNPSDGQAFYNLGASYTHKRDHDRAIANFDRTIALDPSGIATFVYRGMSYEAKGDRNKAIEDYRKALAIPPRTLGPGVTQLDVKWDLDRQAEARQRLAALQSSPPAAHAGLQDDCAKWTEPDLSIRACSELIGRNPRDATAYYHRGNAYIGKGDNDRAIADLNVVISRDPRSAIAYRVRGIAHANKGNHHHAIMDLNEAIRLDPRDRYAYGVRANMYHGKGDIDGAIADLSQVLSILPTDLGALVYRGRRYEDKGDRNRAIEDYRRALAIPPRTLGPGVTQLDVQWDLDRQAEARERLVALSPPAATPPVPAAAGPLLNSPPLGRRVALVIGNGKYKVGPLQNPGNDAAAIAEALERKNGFDKVILRRDIGREGFLAALHEFSREADGAGLGLVYFAGHGMELDGQNYLIPVDARLDTASDVSLHAIPLAVVQKQLDGVLKLKLVILDACRNNPFPIASARRDGSRGLGRIEPEANTLVIYAAKHGNTAEDGVGRKHSPFAEAMLKHISKPGLEIHDLFRELHDDVREVTGRKQEPYVYGTLGRTKFYLRQ